jgi:FkbM family methyltransferase
MTLLGSVAKEFWRQVRPKGTDFLRNVHGVVHIGANSGQERLAYSERGLRVLWIEPIPAVFGALVANIAPFPEQRALRALVTDRDGVEYQFHVSNNEGKSSSILDLKHHADIWPEVHFHHSIRLTSVTLASLFARESIDPNDYGALVMDTQGSELLVLEGAIPLLRHFEYVKTEVCDFESYAGCCQLADIEDFMKQHGYAEVARTQFAERTQGGAYYDVTYRQRPLHV